MKNQLLLEGTLKSVKVESDYKQVVVILKDRNGASVELVITPNEASWIASEINEALCVTRKAV